MEPSIEVLARRIEAVEKRHKDVWDKFQILASILVPATIALAGYFCSRVMAESQVASSMRQAEQAQATDAAGVRVAQANLVATFLRSLTSTNASERKLAIAALDFALPEDGGAMISVLAADDPDPGVREAARVAIVETTLLSSLVEDLFAIDERKRKAAGPRVAGGWGDEPTAAKTLIDHAQANLGNDNGIYNTVGTLLDFRREALEPNRLALNGFLNQAEQKGPRTAALVSRLRKKLAD